jgi:hypothetical protein
MLAIRHVDRYQPIGWLMPVWDRSPVDGYPPAWIIIGVELGRNRPTFLSFPCHLVK